jgi:hypothetical protein
MAIVFGAVLLSGCTTSHLRTYDKVDPSNKTVTVPVGGGTLTRALKDALVEDGWKLAVYRGPEITRGEMGDNTNLERFKTFRTRYTLFINGRRDAALSTYFIYDISMVDNNTGTELVTLTGRGFVGGIVDKFREALNTPRN